MRNRIFLALDVLLAVLVALLSFTGRFEGLAWLPRFGSLALVYLAIAIPLKVALFWRVGLYSRLWHYASIADLEIVLIACLLGAAASFAVGLVVIPGLHLAPMHVPVGVLIMDSLLTGAAITLTRLSLRVVTRRIRARRNGIESKQLGVSRRLDDKHRVLIAGAGDAGGMIAKELLANGQLGLIPGRLCRRRREKTWTSPSRATCPWARRSTRGDCSGTRR